jgi:hypothetical protein
MQAITARVLELANRSGAQATAQRCRHLMQRFAPPDDANATSELATLRAATAVTGAWISRQSCPDCAIVVIAVVIMRRTQCTFKCSIKHHVYAHCNVQGTGQRQQQVERRRNCWILWVSASRMCACCYKPRDNLKGCIGLPMPRMRAGQRSQAALLLLERVTMWQATKSRAQLFVPCMWSGRRMPLHMRCATAAWEVMKTACCSKRLTKRAPSCHPQQGATARMCICGNRHVPSLHCKDAGQS